MSKLFDVSASCAIVTGAASGLGWRFAEVLALAGARVIVGARRLHRLQELGLRLERSGAKVEVIQLDVTSNSSVTACFAYCKKMNIYADILINNAGIAIVKPTIEQSEADWDSVIDTNLKGAWLMSREFVRQKRDGASASIVNISSILGAKGAKQLASYCASKAGLTNLTRSLAIEFAPLNVRVNAVAPGYIETDMNRGFLRSSAGDNIKKAIPMREFGQAEDLDGAILYLCSHASRYVTGSVLTIDGGHTAGI